MMVKAAALAVAAISSPLMVGSAGAAGLHALMIMANAMIHGLMVKRFMLILCLLKMIDHGTVNSFSFCVTKTKWLVDFVPPSI